MKKGIKIGILLIIVIISAISVYMMTNKGVTTDLTTIHREDVYDYFLEDGIVGDSEYYNIYAPYNGEVVSVNFDEGDIVEEGDVIGEISNKQLKLDIVTNQQLIEGYEAQIESIYLEDEQRKDSIDSSISELNSQIEQLDIQKQEGDETQEQQDEIKEQQIEAQKLLIEQQKEELVVLNEELEKYEVLLEAGAVSKSEVDSIKNQIIAKESLIEQSEKQLQILETNDTVSSDASLEQSKNAIRNQISNLESQKNTDYTSGGVDYYNSLIKTANANLELLNDIEGDLEIKSPVSGVVSEIGLKDSNFVTTQTPIAIIKNDSDLIETSVSTRDMGSVDIGTEVNIKIDKGFVTYAKGEVVFIDSEAKESVNQLGVDERRVKVLIQPIEPLDLITGFDVEIEFLTYKLEDAITIPLESVFDYEDGEAVYKVVDGLATVTEIAGEKINNSYIVESGLSEDDLIVLDANNEDIKEGTKIVTLEESE